MKKWEPYITCMNFGKCRDFNASVMKFISTPYVDEMNFSAPAAVQFAVKSFFNNLFNL